jgi:hypothetical protein
MLNKHLLDSFNDTLDGDEFGNCQAWRFATAHVLFHLDGVPEEWQYRHGLCFEELEPEFADFEEQEITELMNGQCGCEVKHPVTVADLIDFGNMLNNLRDILVSEGKDY